MPKGIYQRTESHKKKLREMMLSINESQELNQIRGKYERTSSHKKSFIERMSKVNRTFENSPLWKGDSVGYNSLHAWVSNVLGKPNKCNKCGTLSAKIFDWANISGEYKRDILDWERLCRSCHMKKDGRLARLVESSFKEKANHG